MDKMVPPHSIVPLGRRLAPYGPKCQLCGCQGFVSLEEDSGLPYVSRPLFIVPECGHSLCKRCREKSIEDSYCRVCWPHGTPKDTAKIADSSFQQNLITNGMLVSKRSTLFELKPFGASDQLLPTPSSSRGNRRIPRKPQAMNAMMIGNVAASSLDDLSLNCLKCNATATLVCDHCFTLLCENCFNYMHFDSKESHQGINISPRSNEPETMCAVHKQKVTGRCLDCVSDVCLDCLFENKHQGHKLEKIGMIKKQETDDVSLGNSLDVYLENVNSSINLMNDILAKFECYTQRKSEELNMFFMKLFAKMQVLLRQQQMLLDQHSQKKFQELKETRDCFVKVQEYLRGLKNVSSNSQWGQADVDSVRFKEMVNVFSSVPLCATVLFENLENFVDLKNFNCLRVLSSIGSISCNDTSDLVFPVFANEINYSDASSGSTDINPDSILRGRNEVKELVASVASTDPNKSSSDIQTFDLIKITHLISPTDFYFIEITAEQELKRLNDKLLKLVYDPSANISKPKSLDDLKSEQFVLARFKIDDQWYRAKVMSNNAKKKESLNSLSEEMGVLVKFIDYGNNAMCDLHDICVPSHQYRLHTMKPLCSHGSLYNVGPRTNGRDTQSKPIWSKKSTMFFKKMVENRSLLVAQSFVNDVSGTVELDLYEYIDVNDDLKLNRDYPASLSRAMVFARLADFDNGETIDSLTMCQKYQLPMASVSDPAGSSFIKAAITEVISPHHFYCRVLTNGNKQDELLERINVFIEKFEDNQECQIWCPYVGMYCLAQFSDEDGSVFYYRAKVTKFISPSNITVFFVDFGNSNQVNKDQLRKIPQNLLTSFPNVLIHCKLNGVVPLSGNTNSVWPEEVKSKFRRLTLNNYVDLKIISVSDESGPDNVYCVEVVLKSRRREECINLSEFLIAQNLAQSEEVTANGLAPKTQEIFVDGRLGASDVEKNENGNEESVSVGDQMCRVLVSHVIDPWNLYIRKFTSNCEDPILEVEHAIEFAYLEGEINDRHPPNTDEILFVRAENDESNSISMKRCRVIERLSETSEAGDSNVRNAILIDEGSIISVKFDELLSYTCSYPNPILQQPGLALRCGLVSICPAGSVDGKWSKNSIEALERLVAENEIYVDPDMGALGQSGSSDDVLFEGVIFRELYHIDPSSPKEAIVRNGTDFVPVSFFLKLNGFAIPNKLMKPKMSSTLDRTTVSNKQQVKSITFRHSLPVKPEEEVGHCQSSTPSSALSPKSSEKSPSSGGSRSPKTCGNFTASDHQKTDRRPKSILKINSTSSKSPEPIICCNDEAAVKKNLLVGENNENKVNGLSDEVSPVSTNSNNRSWSSESGGSESDDNSVPTVLFMPKKKGALKLQKKADVQFATPSIESKTADLFELDSSFINGLQLNSEELKLQHETGSSRTVGSKKPAKMVLKFETESNVSPEPVPQTDKLKQVKMWTVSEPVICNSTVDPSENIHFDLSDHGISEFSSIDEVGDKHINVQIRPNTVYKPCIIPNKYVFPFQFEQYDSDGISLRGCCKDVNKFLTDRINSEIDKFLSDRYHGGGYDEHDLYPGMAACGFFRDDGHWYRVTFLKNEGDKFLVRFVDFGNDVRCSPQDFIPLPAFIDVPQLCMECMLEGVQFTDRNVDAKSNKLYAARLKDTILNDNYPVFVSIKEMPVKNENDQPIHAFPVSVYFESTELRHFLVHQGYLEWAIDIDLEFLKTDADRKMYETLVQCSIPFNIKFLQSLIGRTIQVQVTHQVSPNFIMGRVIKPNTSAVSFENFISAINDSQPISSSRLRSTDEIVGQLVYVYNRELYPHVWSRGQIIGYTPSCLINDVASRFEVHLIDYGYSEKVPVSMSIHEVHNIEEFIQLPAEAVPFVFCSGNEDNNSSKNLTKGNLIQIQVESVGKIVQCTIKD